jgi:parallel beta-helix repeat protein
LTIEAGVTVNLNNYYIMVNGSLSVSGTNEAQVYFNDGSTTSNAIILNANAPWNDQTGAGTVIENAVFSSKGVTVNNGSPKLDRSTIYGVHVVNGSPVISNNKIVNGITVDSGSPQISNNNINGGILCSGFKNGSPTIINNQIYGQTSLAYNSVRAGIYVYALPIEISGNTIPNGIALMGYCTGIISKNTITGGIAADVEGGGGIYVYGGQLDIFGNDISNAGIGINLQQDWSAATSVKIHDNTIHDCKTAGLFINGIDLRMGTPGTSAKIQRNSITGNGYGIQSSGPTATETIQSNSITGNTIGIYGHYSSSSTVSNNNIEDSSQYGIYWTGASNGDAANNWWGTTDQSAISNAIYDFNKDFTLGKVNFTPFLMAPNPQALPDPNPVADTSPATEPTTTPNATSNTPEPTATQTPNSSPTPLPTQSSSQTNKNSGTNWLEIALFAALVTIAALAAVILLMAKRTIVQKSRNLFG